MNSIKYLGLLTLSLILVSCATVLFQEPQPIGVSNEKKVPKSMRGVWVTEVDTVTIDKAGYHSMARFETEDYFPASDTLRSYFIKGNDIYVRESGKLTRANLIWQKEDSVSYVRREVTDVILNRQNVLRKAGNYYILNQFNEDANWWSIYLLKSNKNRDFIMLGIEEGDTTFIPALNKLYSDGSTLYTDVRWTEEMMINLIDRGLFKDTLLILNGGNRIK